MDLSQTVSMVSRSVSRATPYCPAQWNAQEHPNHYCRDREEDEASGEVEALPPGEAGWIGGVLREAHDV
jgi:hypothetical protein